MEIVSANSRFFVIIMVVTSMVTLHVTAIRVSLNISIFETEKTESCPVNLEKLEVFELPEFLDISVKIRKGMVTWDNLESKTEFLTGYKPQKMNHVISTKIINVTNHMGTHVDAPAHTDEAALAIGNVDHMDLRTLNGPALVIQVAPGNNLTEPVVQSLNIPRGVTRVLFKTENSARDLWGKTEFSKDYTAFTPEGARWLIHNTDVLLIGIDYLSAATYETVFETHQELLSSQKKIVPLEGLDLRNVYPGWHLINCLPLDVAGMEGSPTRCIAAPIDVGC